MRNVNLSAGALTGIRSLSRSNGFGFSQRILKQKFYNGFSNGFGFLSDFQQTFKTENVNGFRISNGFRVQTDFGFRAEFPLTDFNGFRILKSQTDFISRNGFSNRYFKVVAFQNCSNLSYFHGFSETGISAKNAPYSLYCSYACIGLAVVGLHSFLMKTVFMCLFAPP